ncbi:putative O-methyltransferase YrrM [Microcella putealis]|uniref:Putative O-methyltransferase YrrM n=1 Tax=Microcella putealis TaxID=337005 RepID=A0A4Q7LSJ8_9MICO|nr:class I SAM-dependent methyltransferase [Microcella putealis]RZS57491.1 putative O-methyltransferase YrrM [Microcella putealis]TQM24558.1 putative O-methyltransferase YrrM [Microcella putealis]
MPSKDLSWKYIEQSVVEPDAIAAARVTADELGTDPVSPATGAQLALMTAAVGAKTIIEIGTGVGVSGLWMLKGAPDAHLTSIDIEADHQQAARRFFSDAGHPASRVRLITGAATEVLPRMNESSYDVVLVDAEPKGLIDLLEHAIRLVRVGGVVLVPHALWRDTVADPAKRESVTTDRRGIIAELSQSPAVHVALSPVGDGLLQIVKRSA